MSGSGDVEREDAHRVWLIAGPTASGKSELALQLAEAIGGEIVNADSMQVYGDLRILTARPDEADMLRAPHHLYGVADGAQAWSVGRWLRAATPVLSEIAARGRPAIVVGGTGLYFSALTRGLSDIPDIAPHVRQAAQAAFDAEGEEAFRARLALIDPEAAARIERGDRQRLCRAYEVAEATGRSLSGWQAHRSPRVVGQWRGAVIEPPRPALYARCDQRVDEMLAKGVLEEVRALAARNLDPALPVMKSLGAPELAAYLRGERSLDEAVRLTRQSTRNYAKRQTTWFRGQAGDWPRLAAPDLSALLAFPWQTSQGDA
jgi:tRNA dimethylallyltransferase